MIITKIEPIVLEQHLKNGEKFAYSQGWYNTRTIMIVKITTDEGIVGWGEAFGPAFVHASIIEKIYSPIIVGLNPLDTQVIWEKLYNRLQDHGQKGVAIEAISAIDIALWDIKGKYLNLPIYSLLGGHFRETVKPYATGLYHRTSLTIVNDLIDEAMQYLQKGFQGIKLKVGFGLDSDIKRMKAIRNAIGDSVAFMVDANHAYNAKTATYVGKYLEDLNANWFEEPVPPEDYDGYKEVKNSLCIPIAGGEAEFTRYGFNRLISQRCVDIIQPDCCVMGGFTAYKDIITLAQISNIQTYPHIWGSSIAVAAGIQLAFAQPDYPLSLFPEPVWLELDRTENIFREKLSGDFLNIKDGLLPRPINPGLGIDIDEDLIIKYRIN